MNSIERKEARYQRRKAKRAKRKEEVRYKKDDFDEAFSFKNIYDAFEDCRKEINWKSSTKMYNVKHLKNAWYTYDALQNQTYKFRGFVEFEIYERGKKREIKSIHISDRVVQKCQCNAIVPVLSNSFIYNNAASQKNKGTSMALKRFSKMLNDHYKKHGQEGYALVVDAKSYFDNILHSEVKKTLCKNFQDGRLLGLSFMFLNKENDLSGRTQGKGLSLGCQPNQIYAVGYQNKIDYFAQESKLVESYIRYNDDAVLIGEKEDLKEWLEQASKIYQELGIVLNVKKTQLVKLSKGVKFLKTMHYLTESGRIVRKPWKRSITKMRRKLKKLKRMMDNGEVTFEEIRTSYSSWSGYIKQFDSKRTLESMDKIFNELFINKWKE